MSSPGTAMANTLQELMHIFPLPYSLLAWGFSPVAASDGKHLFYNKIVAYTRIISFPPQKSPRKKLSYIHSKPNVLEEKTTIPRCITFFVIKKTPRGNPW